MPEGRMRVLKLNPGLRLNTRPEGVLDEFHFGDEVGQFDEFFLGIAAGDDDVLARGPVFENVENFLQRQVVIAQDDVELVEQHHAV